MVERQLSDLPTVEGYSVIPEELGKFSWVKEDLGGPDGSVLAEIASLLSSDDPALVPPPSDVMAVFKAITLLLDHGKTKASTLNSWTALRAAMLKPTWSQRLLSFRPIPSSSSAKWTRALAIIVEGIDPVAVRNYATSAHVLWAWLNGVMLVHDAASKAREEVKGVWIGDKEDEAVLASSKSKAPSTDDVAESEEATEEEEYEEEEEDDDEEEEDEDGDEDDEDDEGADGDEGSVSDDEFEEGEEYGDLPPVTDVCSWVLAPASAVSSARAISEANAVEEDDEEEGEAEAENDDEKKSELEDELTNLAEGPIVGASSDGATAVTEEREETESGHVSD